VATGATAATGAGDTARLRDRALAVLRQNHRGRYTVPARGLYPYQWCWDSAPISLGWASMGRWDEAWTELETLVRGQWASGMVPHIIFWEDSSDYFPGPDVWRTTHEPPTTGITQPPLPVSAAARLFLDDPDRDRAAEHLESLWPHLVAWLGWVARARRGPHGGAVVVHPWESGMDNSPLWDDALDRVPEGTHEALERRDVATVAAKQRPTDAEYRRFLGIVADLANAGWDTERQVLDSPFAVEDVAFTAITSRAAADLAIAGDAAGLDTSELVRIRDETRAAFGSLWDDGTGWFRSYDVRADHAVESLTAGGLVALWAGAADGVQTARMLQRLDRWLGIVEHAVPSSDPEDVTFEPQRYWRGPVWVLVNWMVADGLAASGHADRAEGLRRDTLDLVVRNGFCEYFDPTSGKGIGGEGFSWTAALTLVWLTAPSPGPSR
jgi:neutral trehalase